MTEMTLLVGATAFWARARADIAAAKRRVLVQAMSFEGDAAGLAVAAAIGECGAADRRVLVDDYTRVNLNDRSVRSRAARRDTALMAEVAATDRMFRGLVAGGASVRVTNPIGRWGANYPARNHKKLLVADDVAYLGGVNFSDHNFLWPDLMLRLEGREAADFLTGDFEATFAARAVPGCWQGEGLTLTSLDGRSNAAGFAPLLRLIAGAAREITVISPYLSFPFTDALAGAARLGIRVRLITPWANNKATLRNSLLHAAARGGFEVVLLPAMSHLKAILVDDAALVVGSSNFDFVSLAAEEELLAVVTDAAVIADFRARVLAPALAEAGRGSENKVGVLAGWASHAALKIAEQVARSARLSPRTAVDWG